MIIGFTGTKYGMRTHQLSRVSEILIEKFAPGSWFVHGDCIGLDFEAGILAAQIGYKIRLRPSTSVRTRAYSYFDLIEPEEKPLIRDRKIVDDAEFLIATPFQNYNITRSGTWYTIRYAKKLDKPMEIVYPY